MKRIVLATAAWSLLILSCKQSESDLKTGSGIPESLQEEGNSGFSKKRFPPDLVESLYEGLLETNHELAELEKTIVDLDGQKNDSVEAFNKFDQKNKAYYKSAERYSANVKDSLLRIKIRTIIDNSLISYGRKIAANEHLISILDIKEKALTDLHLVLKLIKTLPMIEKYQLENRPSVLPIDNTIRHFEKAIQRADTLAWRK